MKNKQFFKVEYDAGHKEVIKGTITSWKRKLRICIGTECVVIIVPEDDCG